MHKIITFDPALKFTSERDTYIYCYHKHLISVFRLFMETKKNTILPYKIERFNKHDPSSGFLYIHIYIHYMLTTRNKVN